MVLAKSVSLSLLCGCCLRYGGVMPQSSQIDSESKRRRKQKDDDWFVKKVIPTTRSSK